MRKEVVFAIITGSLIGLVVAFGIWRANITLRSQKLATTEPQSTMVASGSATPQATNSNEIKIVLASPENESVVTDNPFKISGATRANSYVVAVTTGQEYITKSDQTGVFELSADASPGGIPIQITAINNNEKTTSNLLLVFSSEFNKTLNSENATPSAQDITNKVNEKIKETAKNPKAYFGTVTDITESTVQIKSKDDQILQGALTHDTTYVKNIGTARDITQKDVAIGDYIIAIGYKATNGVLTAKRIIVTSPVKDIAVDATLGQIAEITTKNIKVTRADGSALIITLPKKFNITFEGSDKVTTKTSSLKVGNQILLIGTVDNTSYTPRRIHVIQ